MRMMMRAYPCQFAVLFFTDASFSDDPWFCGLRLPRTSFRGQITTAGNLLQVVI
jgi:hypothetical protein